MGLGDRLAGKTKLREDLAQARSDFKACSENLTKAYQRVNEVEAKNKELQKKMEECAEGSEKMVNLETSLAEEKKKNEELVQKQLERTDEIRRLQSEYDTLKRDSDSLQTELEEEKEHSEHLLETSKELRSQLAKYEERCSRIHKMYSEADKSDRANVEDILTDITTAIKRSRMEQDDVNRHIINSTYANIIITAYSLMDVETAEQDIEGKLYSLETFLKQQSSEDNTFEDVPIAQIADPEEDKITDDAESRASEAENTETEKNEDEESVKNVTEDSSESKTETVQENRAVDEYNGE